MSEEYHNRNIYENGLCLFEKVSVITHFRDI